MKKLIQFTSALFIACISFSACQQTLSDAQKETIEKELLDFTYDVMDQFNNRDTATVYTNYTDDFILLSRGEYRITTPAEFQEMTSEAKTFIATRDKTIYKIQDPLIEVYSNNVASVNYTYTRTTTFNGGISIVTNSASTWIMVKESGEWKIKHTHISAGKDTYRAVEGDPVWILLNKVAPDKKEVFEEFMFDILAEKSIELGGIFAQAINQFRILRPTEANEDGSFTYVFMMDPLIPDANYEIMHYLSQFYEEEEASEKMKMFTESLVEPQTRIILEQTKY